MTLKRCVRCGKEKLLMLFGKHRKTRDGKAGTCLQCTRERSKVNRAACYLSR